MFKNIICSIFLLGSFSQSLWSDPIIDLDDQRITLHKQIIKEDFELTEMKRTGLKYAGFIAATYLMYRIFNSPKTPKLQDTKLLNEKMKIVMPLLEEYINEYEATKFLSPKWLKKIGKWVRDGVIYTCVLGAVLKKGESIYRDIFGDHDINWFIKEKTEIESALSDLIKYSKVLENKDDPKEPEYQINHAKEMIEPTCNRLVKDIEKVLGYLQYKIEVLPEELVIELKLEEIFRYLLSSAQYAVANINEKLSHDQLIISEVNRLSSDINSVIASFASPQIAGT